MTNDLKIDNAFSFKILYYNSLVMKLTKISLIIKLTRCIGDSRKFMTKLVQAFGYICL